MKNIKKKIIKYLPYIFIGLYATKLGQMWRLTEGTELGERILNLGQGLVLAMESPLPSFQPFDLLVGAIFAAVIRLAVYSKSKNAKKYRRNEEYGSARWGKPEDIAPYVDEDFRNNVILTQTESLTMNNRPKDPKTARNKNVLIIGGSGSGKTRFWLKPNLMQCNSVKYPVSFVVTDPKGSLIGETGKMLRRFGYKIKVLNTINFEKSMKYNPLSYIHSEKDILKLVTCLISNTRGESKGGDPFWEKAEILLYVGYRKAGYSKKYLAEHEVDILLHKAAKKAFDELGVKKLPTVKALQAEYAGLLSEKKSAYAEYRTVRAEMKELLIHKANVEQILGKGAAHEEKKNVHNRG